MALLHFRSRFLVVDHPLAGVSAQPAPDGLWLRSSRDDAVPSDERGRAISSPRPRDAPETNQTVDLMPLSNASRVPDWGPRVHAFLCPRVPKERQAPLYRQPAGFRAGAVFRESPLLRTGTIVAKGIPMSSNFHGTAERTIKFHRAHLMQKEHRSRVGRRARPDGWTARHRKGSSRTCSKVQLDPHPCAWFLSACTEPGRGTRCQ